MGIDSPEYQLSSELRGHGDEVRRICVCGRAGIATSSKDTTVRFWSVEPGSKYKDPSPKVMVGHTSYVGPLAWIAPNEEFPEGRIVSGGRDAVVVVWDLKSAERVQTLSGHKSQVTGIALDDGDIVSSSIDCTLRRWRNGKAVDFWEAHRVDVQAVVKLPTGELVTGSSDTTLVLWRGKTSVRTFAGHSDTVRGLAVMSDLGILSASHDCSVRLWSLTGEVLKEMVGHTKFVYSVDSHISGLVASGSEDCSAKIWKDVNCVQSIEHPGCVWDVKFLENGDLVTACSDGVVRIWTTHPDRTADSMERDSYLSQLSSYKISRTRVGGMELELPGLDALKIPGTSDGQIKVVREGDNGVAYSWNMREQTWDKIEEAVDGPEDSVKRSVFDGKEYDYVFDVDIRDGEPRRKLPYNRSDNPYDAAVKWLLRQNLPLSHKQQIVDIILENTGQKTFSFDPSFCDPYTGSYVPGESSKHVNSAHPSSKHIPEYQLSSDEDDDEDDDPIPQPSETQQMYRRLVDNLEPNETVLKAWKRLKSLPAMQAVFNQLTQDVMYLLERCRFCDIFVDTREIYKCLLEGKCCADERRRLYDASFPLSRLCKRESRMIQIDRETRIRDPPNEEEGHHFYDFGSEIGLDPEEIKDDERELSSADVNVIRRRIANLMQPGETIQGARRRLQNEMPAFNQLTEDVVFLLANGELFCILDEPEDLRSAIRDCQTYEALERTYSRGHRTTKLFIEENAEGAKSSEVSNNQLAAGTESQDSGSTCAGQSDYVYDAASGYYYDRSSGLFRCPLTGKWYKYNEEYSTFDEVSEPHATPDAKVQ